MSQTEVITRFATWLQAEEDQLNAKLAAGAQGRYSERVYDVLQAERGELRRIKGTFQQLVEMGDDVGKMN